MSHPPGILTFVPRGQFNFPRSYVTKLKVRTFNLLIPTFSDNLISFTVPSIPADALFIKLKDVFVPWSSNTYSLDWLVEYAYYTIAPSPVEVEWGCQVSFEWDNTVAANCLVITTDSGDTNYFFDLPPSPADYWPHLPR